MGKRIPMDQAMEAVKIKPNDSIYAKPNKYGYKININHPNIKPLYERFKRSQNIRILSDKERFEFEAIIISAIEKRRNDILTK